MANNKIRTFLQAVRVEMKKTSWPSRSEIMKSTIVVIITILLFALIIGGIDVGFFHLLRILLG
ncbi:preprotein translocase subunit SecE [Candidatus Aerophobetes bacterium]|uniref:Protein translocase subunit SecE n=1 Tax=Aerophobetes bacterium TaxID=2030807 RepID=A0A497E4Y5_UNCAE|nr:preprotein translocase subunit SecE [Candidatus Aerophobetes bacterium]RLE10119.1 MAG: preprotein translocase subunit SecE [Candidatus Aerophobetes bacterium]